MQKERCFKGCLKENKIRRHAELDSASSTLAVLQENSNNTRGRSRIKYGMTTNFDNNGFTLIELLVVVLIIGILAAVALPQYKLVVAKARVNRLLPLMRSIENAQLVYKMANGEYSNDLTVLDIEMPAGGQLSNNNKNMDYNDFTCVLGNSSTTKDSLYCRDKHYSFNLEKYYLSRTICWFSKTDNLSKSLCGYLCQTNTFGSDSTGTYGSCSF